MIGGRTSTLGFKAVGVEVVVAEVPEDGPRLWDELEKDKYAVVMVTEPVFEAIKRERKDFPPSEGLPVVLVVPAVTGPRGIGMARIREKVRKAVGAEI
jgi:vacuolar-type H+-ATPase subunit F/Vma7